MVYNSITITIIAHQIFLVFGTGTPLPRTSIIHIVKFVNIIMIDVDVDFEQLEEVIYK